MKKQIFILLLVVAIAVAVTLIVNSQRAGANDIGLDAAKEQVLTFVNENLMRPGSEVTVKEATEENGLYKITVVMPDKKEIESYLTKDGKKFFPQVMDIDKIKEQKTAADEKKTPSTADVPKAEKAKVELFVMSYCPYGTQMEKGLIPVIETLGDKVDFELKFCDYAMHGEKELKEQLNQYCIQKNEPDKLLSYLNCFLDSENSDGCLKKIGIDQKKLASCVKSTDEEYKVNENFNDKSTYKGRFPTFNIYQEDNQKYGISGSPSLVINGVKVSAARDSASLLKMICSGYENPPTECNKELSSTTPSPGFGSGSSGGGGDASCGS